MKYEQLTIHQKISLKGIFTSKKERRDIGVRDSDEAFNGIHAIMILWNFKVAIEYYLTNDINKLSV